jgi:iron-sulfur cluster insertion protein
MTEHVDAAMPVKFTDAAAIKVKGLLEEGES